MSTPWTEIAAIAAVAAAIIGIGGLIIGRLNYADTELERQNRIENRIGDWGTTIEYEEVQTTRDQFGGDLLSSTLTTDPEYDFKIEDILVTEKTGWQNMVRKIILGFQGDTRVYMRSLSWRMTGNWVPEAPADFELIEGFGFDEFGVEAELDPEKALIRLEFGHADVDEIEEIVGDLIDYLKANLGNIVAVAYEDVQ